MWYPITTSDEPIQVEWSAQKGQVRAKSRVGDWIYSKCSKARFARNVGLTLVWRGYAQQNPDRNS